MNLPFNFIHDPLHSYGILLIPIFWKKDLNGHVRWLGYFMRHRIRLTDKYGFHNCSKTHIY